MQIEKRYEESVAIIKVSGEIIGDNRIEMSKTLAEACKKEACRGIVMDITDVLGIDGVGLGILVATLEYERVILLMGPKNRSVRYLLLESKVNDLFQKFDDLQEALESFS